MKLLIHSQTSTVAPLKYGNMDKLFHPTLYNGCNYIYMLGLKLNHVNKRGPRNHPSLTVICLYALSIQKLWHRSSVANVSRLHYVPLCSQLVSYIRSVPPEQVMAKQVSADKDFLKDTC